MAAHEVTWHIQCISSDTWHKLLNTLWHMAIYKHGITEDRTDGYLDFTQKYTQKTLSRDT